MVHNKCDLSLTYLMEEWLRDLRQSDSGDVLSLLPGTVCLFSSGYFRTVGCIPQMFNELKPKETEKKIHYISFKQNQILLAPSTKELLFLNTLCACKR